MLFAFVVFDGKTGGKLANAFDICPDTYVLPKEYLPFAEAYGRHKQGELKNSVMLNSHSTVQPSQMAEHTRAQTFGF